MMNKRKPIFKHVLLGDNLRNLATDYWQQSGVPNFLELRDMLPT